MMSAAANNSVLNANSEIVEGIVHTDSLQELSLTTENALSLDSIAKINIEEQLAHKMQIDSLRDSLQEQIFGNDSQLVNPSLELNEPLTRTENHPFFEALLILLLVLYMFWIYKMLSKSADRPQSARRLGKDSGTDGTKQLFSPFILLLSSLTLCCLTVDFAHRLYSQIDAPRFMLASFLVWLLSFAWSALALRVTSYATDEANLFNSYMNHKWHVWRLCLLSLSPLVVFAGFSKNNDVLFILALIMFIISYILLFFRGFFIFRSQKISILHSISYLCAVELLPVFFLWGFLFANG